MKNEIVQKKIDTSLKYFDDIYSNKEQYRAEWAFTDAQNKLNSFAKEYKCTNCCTKEISKRLSKKIKRNKMLNQIFAKLHLGITICETIISALFVLVVSEISHSVDVLIESQMLSLYFLMAFALIKVLFENNFIRPAFERLSWRVYHYSYNAVYNLAKSDVVNEIDVEELQLANAGLEASFG